MAGTPSSTPQRLQAPSDAPTAPPWEVHGELALSGEAAQRASAIAGRPVVRALYTGVWTPEGMHALEVAASLPDAPSKDGGPPLARLR